MSLYYSLPYQFPPIMLIPPQANGSSITSGYVNVSNGLKIWLVVQINQGNAATVTITPRQATSLTGAGAKALGNSGLVSQPGASIWLVNNTSTSGGSDILVAQTPALSYTTDATIAPKIVIFELVPEQFMDIPNGFDNLGVVISASNASNFVTATLHQGESYGGKNQPTTYQ